LNKRGWTKAGKSPGTDELPAELYKIFWNDVIDLVIDSYQYTYDFNEMSISQRQSNFKLRTVIGIDGLH
jgi:hypothetical protein